MFDLLMKIPQHFEPSVNETFSVYFTTTYTNIMDKKAVVNSCREENSIMFYVNLLPYLPALVYNGINN